MSKNQAQPPQYVLSSRVKSQSRPSRGKTGYWGEEGDTFLHRQLSASHILNSRAKVCKERFTLSSGTFHFSTLLFTHTAHKTLFPHFLPSGGGVWGVGGQTQSCPQSIQTFHPAPKILPHSALVLSHPAESFLHHIFSFSAPCDSNTEPPQWQRNPVMVHSSGQGERLSRESHFNEDFLAFGSCWVSCSQRKCRKPVFVFVI